MNGKDYNVPCIFQIWIKKEEKRTIITKKKSVCFDFVKKEDTPDLSIRRVGINAGRIDTVIDDKNIQSHNFIKFKSEYNKEKYITILKENYNLYDKNNTVGPRSISKQEIIDLFEKSLNQKN